MTTTARAPTRCCSACAATSSGVSASLEVSLPAVGVQRAVDGAGLARPFGQEEPAVLAAEGHQVPPPRAPAAIPRPAAGPGRTMVSNT